jgi:hypothetical protein
VQETLEADDWITAARVPVKAHGRYANEQAGCCKVCCYGTVARIRCWPFLTSNMNSSVNA